MPRKIRPYNNFGLAGCVSLRITQGRLVGIYASEQSGMEDDPACPYAVVCEGHASLVCVTSLKIAQSLRTEEFCDDCREKKPTRADADSFRAYNQEMARRRRKKCVQCGAPAVTGFHARRYRCARCAERDQHEGLA